MPPLPSRFAHAAARLALTLLALAAPARAALVCDAPEHDFGARPDTDKGFAHTFDIRNAGDAPVTVTRVRASCDCLTASLAKHHIRPGERFPLDTYFDFKTESGPQDRTLHLLYTPASDPAAPAPPATLALRLKGTILTPVLAIPARLDLGNVPPSAVVTATLALVSGRCGPFALSAVAVEPPGVTARYTPTLTATNHTLTLAIPAPPHAGPFSGLVAAATDLPEMPAVPVHYAGRVTPPLIIRPVALNAPLARPFRARLTVSSPFQLPFRVLSAEATAPGFTLAVTPQDAAALIDVSCEAPPATLTDALLRVATDHPACPLLEVPVRFTARP